MQDFAVLGRVLGAHCLMDKRYDIMGIHTCLKRHRGILCSLCLCPFISLPTLQHFTLSFLQHFNYRTLQYCFPLTLDPFLRRFASVNSILWTGQKTSSGTSLQYQNLEPLSMLSSMTKIAHARSPGKSSGKRIWMMGSIWAQTSFLSIGSILFAILVPRVHRNSLSASISANISVP